MTNLILFLHHVGQTKYLSTTCVPSVFKLGILKVLSTSSVLYSMSPRIIIYISYERFTLKVGNKVMCPLPDKCFLLLVFHHLELVLPPRHFLCRQVLVPKLKYVSCYLLKCLDLIFCMLILSFFICLF